MSTLFLFFNKYVNELWAPFKVGTVCFQNLNWKRCFYTPRKSIPQYTCAAHHPSSIQMGMDLLEMNRYLPKIGSLSFGYELKFLPPLFRESSYFTRPRFYLLTLKFTMETFCKTAQFNLKSNLTVNFKLISIPRTPYKKRCLDTFCRHLKLVPIVNWTYNWFCGQMKYYMQFKHCS